MNEDLKKSIENVVLCSEAIDELADSLKHYTDAYAQIRDTLSVFRQMEEQASSDLYETIPRMQEHVADFDRAEKDFSAILEHTAPEFEKTAVLLQNAEKQMQAGVQQLTEHQENFRRIASVLTEIDGVLAETPQLAQISSRIQSALGILGDLDGLDEISRKMDIQIEQIRREKEEIIGPLKNAAAFGQVVRQEREALESSMAERLSRICSDDPDSMSGKLDYLVNAVLEVQEKLKEMNASQGKIGGLFSRRGKENHGQLEKEEPVGSGTATLRNAVRSSVCIVRKRSWTGDFCFAVDHVENGRAYGHTYRDGMVYGTADYSLAEENWALYMGDSAAQIREEEIKKRT